MSHIKKWKVHEEESNNNYEKGFLVRITSSQVFQNVCTCVVYAKRKNDENVCTKHNKIFIFFYFYQAVKMSPTISGVFNIDTHTSTIFSEKRKLYQYFTSA